MSKKGKVIDLFSGRDMEEHGQDTELNDLLTADNGRFVGAIHKDNAKTLRNQIASIDNRRKQIDSMIAIWNAEYSQYFTNIAEMLLSFGVDPNDFDPNEQFLMISEEGKVWIVDKPSVNDTVH